jgi:hypothetical protein
MPTIAARPLSQRERECSGRGIELSSSLASLSDLFQAAPRRRERSLATCPETRLLTPNTLEASLSGDAEQGLLTTTSNTA